MALENGKVSSYQLGILTTGMVLSSATLLAPSGHARQAAWLAILLGTIETLGVVWVFALLFLRFRDKTFPEIAVIVFGRYLGPLVASLFLWFLFHIGALFIGDFSEFLTTAVMPETPRVVFGICLMLVAVYAVRGGLEVLVRCAQVIVPVVMVEAFLDFALSLGQLDLQNLQPVLGISWRELLFGAHDVTVFPLAESVVCLMAFPFLARPGRAFSSASKAIAFSGLFFAIMSIRNIALLGGVIFITSYPPVSALRLISVGDIFSRLEVLLYSGLLGLGFLAISFMLYGANLGIAQLLDLRTYRLLVLPLGILMVILSETNFSNYPQLMEFASRTALVYHPIFEVGIPLVTLVVAMLRGLPKDSQ